VPSSIYIDTICAAFFSRKLLKYFLKKDKKSDKSLCAIRRKTAAPNQRDRGDGGGLLHG